LNESRYLVRNHGARTKWHYSFQALKELLTQNPILKISFRNEREIKTFSDEGKLIEFVATRLTLNVLLKEIL